MNEQIIYLHSQAPNKPVEMSSCNGCGVCCALEICPLGRVIFRHKCGPCPALEWAPEVERYLCGLSYHPGNYFTWLPVLTHKLAARLCRRWIAIDYGCDSAVEIVGNGIGNTSSPNKVASSSRLS